MPEQPEKIGKYEILGELGRGGMGTVYRARDPILDRVVALKVMAGEVVTEPGMQQRFLREARSAARLQHPNIVTVYEFGEVDGVPFIAMEFLAGENLADAAERGHLSELADKLSVAAQLCEGLAFAHRHGVIHRDVKPTNVILPGGPIKIVDFGIAWLEGGATTTRTGQVLGTPSYMAPEQFTGTTSDHRIDMWAAGVILYELLAGHRPFRATNVPALIYQIVHAPAPPLDARRHRVPPALATVVERALAKEPAQRFPDLEAMARAIREAGNEVTTGVTVDAAGRPPATSTRRPAGLGDATPPTLRASSYPPTRPTTPLAARTPTAWQTGVVDEGVFGEDRRVQLVVLSPDESLLVAGGTDGSIRFWDLATRTKVVTLRNRVHLRTGHGSATTALTFSADGTLLVSGHLDGAIYLWEVASGLELDAKLGHDGPVGGLGLPPGGATLVSGGGDATLKFWDLQALRNGDARRELRRQPDPVSCLALAKGGGIVISGHANHTLRAHDAADHRLVATLHGHRAPVCSVAISPTGDDVASGARDGAVRIHSIDSREVRGAYQEHGRAVSSLTFFPDGRRVASVSGDSTVVIWDPGEPELPTVLRAEADQALVGLCLTGDGRRLIGASGDGRFRVWLMQG